MSASMPSARAAYVSRGRIAGLVPRREPVLHAGLEAPGPFSSSSLAEFDRKGFVVVPNLFSTEEVAAIVDALYATVGSLPGSDPRLVREPSSDALRSLFAFHAMDGLLGRLASDARLVDRARQILGSSVYVHQSRINRKPGFDGREFAWHSDFETWHAEDGMPTMRALSVSLALTRNDASNGPLMVIPGSHRVFVACVGETPPDHHETSLRRQEYGVPDRVTLAALAAREGIEVVTVEPGSVIFFDCNLLHGSAGNITPMPRSNAFVVYNSIENRLGPPTATALPRPEYVSTRDPEAEILATEGPLVRGGV